jgi:CDP-diacylglycerol--glycerol-3-phosphate 3-phosphatidyltransferase
MENLANILTIFRLILLPFIIVLFYIPAEWAAWTCLTLYIIGAVTDFLDGWVARKFSQVSDFGTFMDPISDKIFVVVLLLMLVAVGRIEHFWVQSVVIIIVREFLVAGLREFLGPKNIKLPVTPLAKWKTAIQMISIGILIIGPYVLFGEIIGLIGLTIAAAMTAYTGWNYLKIGLAHFKE